MACWQLAATAGDAEAQYNLALAHEQGKGTALDPALALHWFTRAAEQGVARAQGKLGLLYATGQGVGVDLVEACKWFLLGEAGGEVSAQANLAHARSLLSTEQWQEAARRVASFQRLRGLSSPPAD